MLRVMRGLAAVVLACMTLCRTGLAQDLDPAAAEVLFAAGRKAMTAGDYATACAKFAESQRLDPAAGTLINLADCLDEQGKVASSWQKWREARGMLRPGDDRLWAVDDRIKKIEARLPRLVVTLKSDVPKGTVVYRDDVKLGTAAFGLALPVDPGAHTIRVEAPRREVKQFEIELSEGERITIQAEPGEELAPAEPIATAAPAAATKKSVMDDECTDRDGRLLCRQGGLRAADSGKTLATVANVGVAAGILGIGVGAYLILSHDDAAGTTTAITARPLVGGASFGLSRGF
jgi:hypothetical protein